MFSSILASPHDGHILCVCPYLLSTGTLYLLTNMAHGMDMDMDMNTVSHTLCPAANTTAQSAGTVSLLLLLAWALKPQAAGGLDFA